MVTGVTFWGVSDEKTWLDNFPVSGRKNWPLLFDEEMRPKLAYTAIIDF
jgi:endo-1,4-beta-xylanase